MVELKRVGVLTSGGDCPGLNSAIKAVAKKLHIHQVSVLGIRDGFLGLQGKADVPNIVLDANFVRHIDRLGGTVLGTSRTNPVDTDRGADLALSEMKNLGLDAIIAIGGDGTMGAARDLHGKFGFPVVGIPKTIDRDLSATDYSLGFESAVEVITECVDSLRSTAESHSRIFVVEVMGHHVGHLAYIGGICAGASITLIPEVPFSLKKVSDLLRARKKRGIRYSIVLVAENAQCLETKVNSSVGVFLAESLSVTTGFECRAVNLSHLQRGGKPSSYDRRFGFYLGTAAAEAVLSRKFGHMVAVKKGEISLVPFEKATKALSKVDVDSYYDQDLYQAKRVVVGSHKPFVVY